MTLYAADTDGATCCMECLHGLCITRSHICEAEHCQCDCKRDADSRNHFGYPADDCDCRACRAARLDDRSDTALANIARDIENEQTDYEQLRRERFGWPRRSAA